MGKLAPHNNPLNSPILAPTDKIFKNSSRKKNYEKKQL